MVKVLVYSQCVAPSAKDNMMERTLSGVLLPLTKYIYQNKTEDNILLFLTAEEVRYLEENHPEQNMFITSLVKRNAITMLTGTYHNINPIIFTSKTISDDIEQMTTFLRRQYTRRPVAFFPYASLWTPTIAAALENVGIEEVFFPSLRNITNYPEGSFEITTLNKSIKVHHANDTIDLYISSFISGEKKINEVSERICEYINTTKEDIVIGLNLDALSTVDQGAEFAIEILSCVRNYNVQNKTSRSVNKLYPQFFLPSGCYSSLYKESNLLGDILQKDEHFYLSKVMFIKRFLQFSGNKKLIGDKKYLDALLCSIASVALFLVEYSDVKYQTKLNRDFYTILSSLSAQPFFDPTFRSCNLEHTILLSKGIFVLVSPDAVVEEFGMLNSGIDFVKDGWAFKDVIREENGDSIGGIIYKVSTENKRSNSDIAFNTMFNGVVFNKEFHVRTSSVTVHINFKNTEKKTAAFTYALDSVFSFLTYNDKKNCEIVNSLRFHVNNNNDPISDSIHISLSKDFSFPLSVKTNDNKTIFTPAWDIRLKKDESFDLTLTIRYDKGQEAQK